MKKLSFLAATTISLAALVSSCGSSNPQSSSELQGISHSKWLDVTTTGMTPSTCAKTPDNCTMQDPVSKLKWSKRLADESAWHRAIIACVALSHNGQKAGDWRLPTKDELIAASANGIKDAASGDWISESGLDDLFWSATSWSARPSSAWMVFLASGSTIPNVKYSSGKGSVVCVQ